MMRMLDYYRKNLEFLTIEVSIIFLRHLGGYENDKVVVFRRGSGTSYVKVADLTTLFPQLQGIKVAYLKPVYFYGGPVCAKLYRGNYLTFLVDRAIYTACEKGKNFVDSMIEYCKGFVYAESQS